MAQGNSNGVITISTREPNSHSWIAALSTGVALCLMNKTMQMFANEFANGLWRSTEAVQRMN